jgi:spore maturation protein CgeB
MRIVLVADQWDYGDPARGRSFEWDTFHQTLIADGHNVLLFDLASARKQDDKATDTELRGAVAAHEAEIVLCILFEDEIDVRTLAAIKDTDRVPVVNWFCDDHWRYDAFSRKLAPALTLSVTTSSSAAQKYERDGFPHLMSQWGYANKSYGSPPPEMTPRSDIVFVGQPYGSRAKILTALEGALPAGSELKRFGFGTPNGRVTSSEMIALFNTSAGSINFSSSWQPNLLGRLRRRQLLPRRVPPQLKARVFEVTGAGGFLLTESSEDLPLYFKAGEEVSIFDNVDELTVLARRAIQDPEWRYSVTRAGFERCHAEHTMSHRLNDVFQAALR